MIGGLEVNIQSVRWAEGSHERNMFGDLYGFLSFLLEILLVSSYLDCFNCSLMGKSGPNMKPQVWSCLEISPSMKSTLEEASLVSEFVSMLQLVWRHTFIYIFINILNIAYPVYALCNLPQLVLLGDPFNFRIMNSCQVVFMRGPNWGVRNGIGDVCLISSSLPALGRLIKEDHLRSDFCQSCWYCMILANDPCAKENQKEAKERQPSPLFWYIPEIFQCTTLTHVSQAELVDNV